MTEKSSLALEESLATEEDTAKGDRLSDQFEEEFELPKGDVYALNSRRLNATQLQGIAESLKLPTACSTPTIRQLIEGKLIEMGHEPTNVQVILQGKDNLGYKLFLVDENGIISTFAHLRDREHVTSQPVDTNVDSESSGAPRELANDLERLKREFEIQYQELAIIIII